MDHRYRKEDKVAYSLLLNTNIPVDINELELQRCLESTNCLFSLFACILYVIL